ncbi:uncharacterized protein LOC123563811 [Mercenaria mercenaria]|uniref:uncharacterized protein LOC123563811 n=1 Tax=Mercenaria mercenaria TaxID=6596 RepID=UPI00234E713F|nr:uncharacterized protein LOC123563811 [Mercenaria mercenaria]
MPKDSRIYYKFLVVRSYTGVIVDIENIAPRQLHVGQTPITVGNTFNRTTYKRKRATHKQSRARNDQKGKKLEKDIQYTKSLQKSTGSAIKYTMTNEKTGHDISEFVPTTLEIPEILKIQTGETVETKDVQTHSTDTAIDQSTYQEAVTGNEDQTDSFNKANFASYANVVPGENESNTERSGRKRLFLGGTRFVSRIFCLL